VIRYTIRYFTNYDVVQSKTDGLNHTEPKQKKITKIEKTNCVRLGMSAIYLIIDTDVTSTRVIYLSLSSRIQCCYLLIRTERTGTWRRLANNITTAANFFNQTSTFPTAISQKFSFYINTLTFRNIKRLLINQ